MILEARTWKGGSTYEVTVSPDQLVERLPLPGEEIELAEMGRVRVMSGYSLRPDGGWAMPSERRWHLVVQTPDIGPGFDNLDRHAANDAANGVDEDPDRA